VAIGTGLDGTFGGTLAQDGRWYGHTGSWTSGQAWWEIVGPGNSGGSILMNLTVPPGNVAQATTAYVSSPSEYEFFVDNSSTGHSASYTDINGPFSFVGGTYDAIAADVNQASVKNPPSSSNPGVTGAGGLMVSVAIRSVLCGGAQRATRSSRQGCGRSVMR